MPLKIEVQPEILQYWPTYIAQFILDNTTILSDDPTKLFEWIFWVDPNPLQQNISRYLVWILTKLKKKDFFLSGNEKKN